QKSKQKVDLEDYQFVGSTEEFVRAPYVKWLNAIVGKPEFAVRINEFECTEAAVQAGLGIGVLSEHTAQRYDNLAAIVPPSKKTSVPLWIVTHRDLQNVVKVREFIHILQEHAPE
ncbi:MAG: LysR substrate-binding domain-containing protein, partial [Pseudomonadota bacterium]